MDMAPWQLLGADLHYEVEFVHCRIVYKRQVRVTAVVNPLNLPSSPSNPINCLPPQSSLESVHFVWSWGAWARQVPRKEQKCTS